MAGCPRSLQDLLPTAATATRLPGARAPPESNRKSYGNPMENAAAFGEGPCLYRDTIEIYATTQENTWKKYVCKCEKFCLQEIQEVNLSVSL